MEENAKRKFLEDIGLKASEDEAFKKLLMDDPAKVIETRLKVKLPKNLKITVLEEKPDELFIVLPLKGGKDLSDSELASVSAGGICWHDSSCGGCPCNLL
jgi:hypothetical protein